MIVAKTFNFFHEALCWCSQCLKIDIVCIVTTISNKLIHSCISSFISLVRRHFSELTEWFCKDEKKFYLLWNSNRAYHLAGNLTYRWYLPKGPYWQDTIDIPPSIWDIHEHIVCKRRTLWNFINRDLMWRSGSSESSNKCTSPWSHFNSAASLSTID